MHLENGIVLNVETEDEGKRLDIYLSDHIKDYSRNSIKKLINDENIKVNNFFVKASYKVKPKDNVEIIFPTTTEIAIEPQNIPLDIVYEDDDIIVINKPKGMVVHPAPGNYRDTLVNALLYYTPSLSQINGSLRPGIVHRIDKDTSGLLVVAKTDTAHIKLAQELKEHNITRKYRALTEGVIKEDCGRIDEPIGRHPIDRKRMAVVSKNGKRAITHYKVLERFDKNTLIEAKLETGRTHQIRVHMEHIGHPIVGDPVYGYRKQKFNLKGQLLHAKELSFLHPITNVPLKFKCNLPEDFFKIINILRVK